METTKDNLPRPSAEVIKEYEEVYHKLDGLDPSWTDEEANAVIGKLNDLEASYDWSNFEFTDPATGKKGLLSVKGEQVVPALYDAFPCPGSYLINPHQPIIAVLNGKYGLLSGNAGGQVIKSFSYDSITPANNIFAFVVRKANQEWMISMQSNDNPEP